jgi:translation elongation factor EF-Tu-like GTPase
MEEKPLMTRLIVETVHRISSRPWVFVTGRLEGGDLHIGDEMTVTDGNAHTASAVVRSIELHSPPGKTTIAVDAEFAGALRDGVVLLHT